MLSAPARGGPVIAAVPPAPMGGGRANKSGGGKGLVIGLGAIGGILLIAIAVLAARSMSSKKEDLPPLALTDSVAGSGNSGAIGTGPVATIEPVVPAATAAITTAATPIAAERVPPVEPSKPPSPSKPATPAPVNPAQACDACIADASGGNISGAAANFSRCTDAAKKAECAQAAKRNAPRAAKSAALNGNCAQAKAIIAAAQALGATSGALLSGLNGSSCK
jgi:hypothetical protein